jgi:sugar lactone lactonase YvrE
VHVFDPEGNQLGRIKTPEQCHNFTIGGEDLKSMFFACRTSVYRLPCNIPGIAVCPAS